MLKALFKKQLLEMNSFYFTDRRKGTRRSKAGTAAYIALFVFLFLVLAGTFFGVGLMLCDSLVPLGMGWYYFTLMAMLSILFGTFGSVFNTYAALYYAKDNDLLLSMPIPPRMILIARMGSVFLMSLLYSAMVWLPACAAYMVAGGADAVSAVLSLLLTLFIAGFVTVLTCALGYVVALISGKLRNKSAVTVIITLAFLAVYYYGVNRFNEFLTQLVDNAGEVGNSLRIWARPICWAGEGACGNVLSALLFVLLVLALCVLCVFILSRGFIKITTANRGEKKKAYVKKTAHASGIRAALLRKEFKRLASSSTYMLNCGLGLILTPGICVYLLTQKHNFGAVLGSLSAELPELSALLPAAAAVIVLLGTSMNLFSAPSVSLEGKSIWVSQTLPVPMREVLLSKFMMHLLLNLFPAVLCPVLLGLMLDLSVASVLLVILTAVLFTAFLGALGLMLNLKKPNLTWTNEAIPVKQGMSVGISLLGGFVVTLAVGAGAYFLRAWPAGTYLLLVCAVFAGLIVWMVRWLSVRGAEIFASL